jgi:hypothetical protein
LYRAALKKKKYQLIKEHLEIAFGDDDKADEADGADGADGAVGAVM